MAPENQENEGPIITSSCTCCKLNDLSRFAILFIIFGEILLPTITLTYDKMNWILSSQIRVQVTHYELREGSTRHSTRLSGIKAHSLLSRDVILDCEGEAVESLAAVSVVGRDEGYEWREESRKEYKDESNIQQQPLSLFERHSHSILV